MAFFNKKYHPPGTAPGTLTATASAEARPLQIRLIDYSPSDMTIRDDVAFAECHPYLMRDTVTWVHIEGRPTETALSQLGEAFGLHPLALEDVINTGQRPKIEPYENQLFVVMSLPLMVDDLVEVQQVSFFLSNTYLVSFCDGDFSAFNLIVKRLQDNGSRLRARGVDFLLYSMLDMVIDQGFPILEQFGLQLEDLELKILDVSGGSETLERIHIVKRELILLRRMLWPQRDVINQLLRDNFPQVKKGTLIYLRDCYDHTVQVMDLLETYRDMTGSMLDIYLSSVSNRMNDIMRLLTVIATIFIPLTFIVGVYGMNFDRSASRWNMPELGWTYGYPLVWLIMIAIAVGMIRFFRRRGWL